GYIGMETDPIQMSRQPKLLAVSGPLRGMTFEFGDEVISVGRRDTAIVIDHKSVSRRHCVFSKEGSSFKVRDLHSRNGTVVNGERVEERALGHGDRILIGNTNFIFLMEDEDLASLLSEVHVIDDTFDPATSIQIQPDQTSYLHPENVLTAAA